MLRLYGRKTSINVQKVAWALGELALQFDWVDREGQVGNIGVEGYESLNPARRVPTLVDNRLILNQSNSIVRYLAAIYKGDLWCKDPAERAQADRWMEWQSTDLSVDMTPTFWGLVRTPEKERNLTIIDQHIKNLTVHLELLDKYLENREYIVGNSLSMGDIPIGTGIYRYMSLPIEHPHLPNIESWYKRLQDREAYQKYVMVPIS
ncbi:MAG: glutathione S-transferase family protein [Rhodospirillales bacterium]